MNLQGETYSEELAEGAEPQDLCEAADKEVARLTAALEAVEQRYGVLVVAAATVVWRLRLAAAFHLGDEHPVLEETMLDLASGLTAVLEGREEKP